MVLETGVAVDPISSSSCSFFFYPQDMEEIVDIVAAAGQRHLCSDECPFIISPLGGVNLKSKFIVSFLTV